MVLSLIGQSQRKRKRRIGAPPVMCEYGVKANYGLVPLELGIGHWCGHMVDYDEVGYCCGKHEINFSSIMTYDLIFGLNRALGNVSENLMMVKLNSWIQSRQSK